MDSFRSKKVYTSLRPAKIVTLIRKGQNWRNKCLKIIEAYCQVWGGGNDLIIPTNGNKIDDKFWFLIENFDPDYFYVYGIPGKGQDYISDGLKEDLKGVCPFLDDINESPIQGIMYPNHISYPLTFWPDIIGKTDDYEFRVINKPFIDYKGSKWIRENLKLIYHSVFGYIGKTYETNLTKKGFSINELDLNDIDKLSYSKIWNTDSNLYENSPMNFSKLKLGDYLVKGTTHEVYKSLNILVVGDTIEDFCLYYGLSRLRKDVVWAPYSLIKSSFQDLMELKNKIKNKLDIKLLNYNHQILFGINDIHKENQKTIITSISKSLEELERVKKMLMESAYSDWMEEAIKNSVISRNIYELLPYVLNGFEYDNCENSYVTPFIGGNSVYPIETPIPLNFKDRSFEKHYWITEIEIENYNVPKNLKLIDILSAFRYSNNYIRVSNKGMAFLCPNNIFLGQKIDHYLVKPNIHLLKPFEIFKRIFGDLGFEISISDKGKYTSQSIKKFGSLDEIAQIFQNKNYKALFDQFVKVKKDNEHENHDEGLYLKDRRRYMDMSAIKKIIGSEPDFQERTTNFIKKGILHRGFIFKCEVCNYCAWYNIDEIDDKFKCKACGTLQYYGCDHLIPEENLVEPPWFYKLNEMIYKGYVHNMIVPILTLYKLKKASKESFLFVTELEITNNDSKKQELDICCISDGNIIIGECKINNDLVNKELGKYNYFYNKLKAHKVVLSTFNEKGWSDSTNSKIKEKLGNINYEIYDKNDLN